MEKISAEKITNRPFIRRDVFFFVLLFAFFGLVAPHIIVFNEIHSGFYFGRDHLLGALAEWGGMLYYVSSFIAQFFYYLPLGALLLAALTLSTVVSARSIICRLSRRPDDLGFSYFIGVAYAALLNRSFSCDLEIAVAALLALLLSRLFISIRKPGVRIIVYLLLAPFLHWLFTLTLLFLSAFLIVVSLIYENRTAKLYGVLYLLIHILAPYTLNALFVFSPGAMNMLTGSFSSKSVLFPMMLPLLGSFPAIPLVAYFIPKIKSPGKPAVYKALTWLFLTLFAGVSFNQTYDKAAKANIIALKYADREEWDLLLKHCNENRGLSPLLTLFADIALMNKGRLAEDALKYDQSFDIGWAEHPYPVDWLLDECGGLFYYYLGLPNETHYWFVEASQSLADETPFIAKKIALSLSLSGHPAAAEMYFKKLERTLFYRKWVRKVCKDRDYNLRMEALPRFFMKETPPAPKLGHYFSGGALLENLERYHDLYPRDKNIFEALSVHLILRNEINAFYRYYVPEIQNYHYEKLPGLFQEAILIYQMTNPADPTARRFTIDREISSRNAGFLKEMRDINGENRESYRKKLFDRYGDTLFYHNVFSR
ncbi:MAG: DUF6057 family protein [Elusimicrobia bacterium]|nr:DUF6057 family protein [Elusimicrobiota bacterium]